MIVTTTGSFPKTMLSDGEIENAIRKVISLQLEEEMDVLVDGQLKADIVGIFAHAIGLEGAGMPYKVTREIQPLREAVTLEYLQLAAKYAQGAPLKAHLTGPTVIAENCQVTDKAPAKYHGKNGFYTLTMDIAEALAEEARQIAQQKDILNVQYLQIDEPSLAFGSDMKIAQAAVQKIVQTWKKEEGGLTLMHVCWDFAGILEDILAMPIDVLNLSIEHFRELGDNAYQVLRTSEKRFALGVVPVNTDHLPVPERIAREALFVQTQLGPEQLWGLTPVCGLRESPENRAREILHRLRETANVLENRPTGENREVGQ